MAAKRALIVDDSRSARLFLARMLEKYGIDVDDAETAEAALEYLASHRPDVIFMDHLMPGMDGFQAVQAIKNNPLTATIPILMYTSQEGELYLGQARALGALGVLPKQIKPADVSKVLYQLHLLADRRSPHQGTFQALNLPPASNPTADSAANDSAVVPAMLTEGALREQFAELRRALVAGVDTQTERITAEVRALLLEALPPRIPSEEALPPPPVAQSPQWGWLVASIALAIALGSTALWWQQSGQLRVMREELGELRTALTVPASHEAAGTAATSAPADRAGTVGGAGVASGGSEEGGPPPAGGVSLTLPSDAHPLIIQVPYGAEPLTGPRQESIRVLLERMIKDNRTGVLDIRSYPGRYCLVGNSTDGYSPAPDELPFAKCDLVGNPPEEALSAAQRVPLPFANMIAGYRHASHGALEIQAGAGDVSATLRPYPATTPDLTAGEWNRIASANNRIEIRVR